MAGRERMHTKRFWRSSESSRETHFHVFSLVPASERVSERAPACDAVANPGNGALLLLRPSVLGRRDCHE